MIEINDMLFSEDIIKKADNAKEFNTLFNVDYNIKISDKTYFFDDIWDFTNKNTQGKKGYFYIYKFSEIDYRYKFYFKKTVLDLLVIEKNKAGSVYGDYLHIKTFILFLQKNNIFNCDLLNKEILIKFFNLKSNILERTAILYRTSFKPFFKEIEFFNKELNYSEVFNYLEVQNKENRKKRLAEIESGKTELIPDSMFDKMVSLALHDLKDDTLSDKDKLIASLIILFAETGIRIEEMQKIEVNKIENLEVDDGKQVSYLEFKTFKTVRNKVVGYRWTETYLSDKAELAYNTMVKISEESRKVYNSNYAYLYGKGNKSRKMYSQIVIRSHVRRFIVKHYHEFNFSEMDINDIKKLSKFTVSDKNLRYLGADMKDCMGKIFFYINPHQFRVTVCNRLYKNKVPLELIRKHMNHLDEDMTEHYLREEIIEQEKLKATKIIQQAINKNGTLLEINEANTDNVRLKKELRNSDFRGDYEAINKFLIKNKFNIKKDLSEVINILILSNTPITELPEGFCARNALANICKRQEYISSIEDLYFGGINIPCLDYLHITYERFLEKAQIVKHNEQVFKNNAIYSVEYSREKKALKRYVTERLIPELNLIKKQIDERGIDNVIFQYPMLNSIAYKVDKILAQEVVEWIA